MISEKRQKPNIVRISDGLGNQLFQYAFGYSLYRRTGREVMIDPMYSGKLRHYQLDFFCIDFVRRFVGKITECIQIFTEQRAFDGSGCEDGIEGSKACIAGSRCQL